MSKCELSLKVLQIANFSQITHSPTFGRAFTHENEKLWISRKSYFFSFNAWREVHTAAVVLTKKFCLPKNGGHFEFSKFLQSTKMLISRKPCYMERTQQNFWPAGYLCRVAMPIFKIFCLAKYSGHFELLNFLQNTKMLISWKPC